MMAIILSGYLQQFFRVSDVLLLDISWRHQCGWAVFTKLQATVFPAISTQCFCVGVFLGIYDYLGVAFFQGIFLVANCYFNLLLYSYYGLLYTFWVFIIATYVVSLSLSLCLCLSVSVSLSLCLCLSLFVFTYLLLIQY